MKCKLSKLFFLVLVGAVSFNGYSQTAEGRKKIVKDYDLTKLNKLAKEFDEQYKVNYAKALEVVKEKGMPINGVDPQGAYFSLKGIDEATGEILYYKTSNNTPTNSSVQTARAQHLYNGGSLGINIEGQLMTLGIWDGGQPQASHQNLGIPRITNKDGENTVSGSADFKQQGIDHATHVAGTMIGNGIAVPNARGIAFQGFLWANTWENDITEMTSQAGQGLLMSNHSYGITNDGYVDNPGVFGRYTQGARNIDVVTSNAPNYLPVFAAGNDRNGIYIGNTLTLLNPTRGGYDLLTHDNVAKNGVVVAAIEGFTDYTNANNVVMSTFSQWGPTDDFRIKPDISSKGVAVYSSNMPTPTSVNSYASYPGTSMAAPAVTAVFALWQQYFKELNAFAGLENMRAASLKALMAHTASPAGKYVFQGQTLVSPKGPNPVFGWGVINAKGGAEILGNAFKENPTVVFKELELANGGEYVLNVTVDGTQELNATIAWTDLPSNVVSGTDSNVPLLINDLDLRVYRPDDTAMTDPAMPYMLNKNWSNLYTTTGDNNVDPIEKVNYFSEFDGLAEAGTYKVVIKHKGTLTGGSQKFTLIVDGGVVSFAQDNVSVDEVEFENLKIYPNPATDMVSISSDMTTIEGAKVTVYDMIGKKVYENDSLFKYTSEGSIDVSNFNTGVYLVEILKDNKKDTRKIIVK